MPYTIKDVAEKSGVSIATVSKVINNKMYVSQDTKAKVLEVMQELNYSPNVSAASLARKSNNNIIYADSFSKGLPYHNPHMFDIICGISERLSEKNYRLSLLNINSEKFSAEEIIEQAIVGHASDGIIINSTFVTHKIEKLLLNYDFPQMCIGSPDFDSILSWIDTNHTLSSNIAVEHLLQIGCKKIAFVGGDKQEHIFMERLFGYQVAMKKNNLPIYQHHIVYNPPDIEQIKKSTIKLLSDDNRPDGIICANSLIATGVALAIDQLGLKAPNDIAYLCFDRYPYTPTISPTPTVIDIDLFDLGVQTGNMMLKKIKNPAVLIQSYTALPELIKMYTT